MALALTAGETALAGLVATAGAEPVRTIDYLYVDASESGGSGGHAAIRFGERVFHFQWTDAGLLGVNQEDSASFRRQYALLENRTIRAIRIPVSDETFDLVHAHFAQRRLIQHQHVQILDSLAADRRLLESLRAVRAGQPVPAVAVEGAGYFVGDAASPALAGAPSAAIESLRERIAAAHGSDFLDVRRAEVERRMADLDPREIEPPATEVSTERVPPPVYGFAQRYLDGVAALQALEVIRTARRLVPGTYLAPGAAPVAFADGDAAAVDALTAALADSLVRLVRSDRPDWGSALLVGLARLEALDQTRRAGAWVFLDVMPPDAPRLSRRRLARRPDLLTAVLREARQDFETARARILRAGAAGDTFRELDFVEFEAAGNRLAEALRARHDAGDLRLFEGRHRRAWPAGLTGAPVPSRAVESRDEALSVAMAREAHYAAALHRLYGYQLLTRNCVTEIFQEIDRALAGNAQSGEGFRTPQEASRERLGGHLDTSGLRFIPAVSAAAAAEAYAGSVTVEIPSYRRATLTRLYREEPALWVFLRESNTLTSTLYDGHPDDSAFLFFTDDAGPVRPVFGAANVLTGVGATLAGIVALPFDRGKTLWAGLKGVAFSLPELVFVNLRKGTFAYPRGGGE